MLPSDHIIYADTLRSIHTEACQCSDTASLSRQLSHHKVQRYTYKGPNRGVSTSLAVVKEQCPIPDSSSNSTSPHLTGNRWASLSSRGLWLAALITALFVAPWGMKSAAKGYLGAFSKCQLGLFWRFYLLKPDRIIAMSIAPPKANTKTGPIGE
jgi:hypothetical protein